MTGQRRENGEREYRVVWGRAERARRFVATDTLHLSQVERVMAQAAIERLLWLERSIIWQPDAPLVEPGSEAARLEQEAAAARQQRLDQRLEQAIDRMVAERIGRRRRSWWQRWRH